MVKNKGFSLLEVLIAMAIITIGLVAALNLIAFSLHSYKTSSQQVIYANQAQECIELARNERDKNPGDPRYDTNPYPVTCTRGNVTLTTYLYDWKE